MNESPISIIVLLSSARFASAVGRLCLGPLLPLLTASLHFPEASKPKLLSAYSSGYILTQIGGGVLADRYGANRIICATLGTSACVLLYIATWATTVTAWANAFFVLGLIAGPLFPAGSTAIAIHVVPAKRAAAAAMVDAAAAAGTTVAALTPLLAEHFGSWRVVFHVTAAALAIVSAGSLSLVRHGSSDNKAAAIEQSHDDAGSKQILPKTKPSQLLPVPSSNGSSRKYIFKALLSPASIATYLCHSADNFTKYSVNAWASTMLVGKFGASLTVVGAILATQEAVGVISRLSVGMASSSRASFGMRGITSCLAFVVQGVALLLAFRANSSMVAAALLVVSAVAVGAHSIGFRPIYMEAAPDHAGSISGLGNTIASLASAVGPILIGNVKGWDRVGFVLLMVNLGGAASAMMIARAGQTNNTKKALSSSE